MVGKNRRRYKTTNKGSNLVVLPNFGKALLYYQKVAKMDHVRVIKQVKELQGGSHGAERNAAQIEP